MDKYIRIVKKISMNSGLIIGSIVIALFLGEFCLVLLDFPSEVPKRFSHPVNYEEVRKTIEFEYVFKTNSRGLRYREIPIAKSPYTYRVFVSGDSFTEGVGVIDSMRFTNRLEDHFQSSDRRVEFINGGLSGTGPKPYGRLFLKVGLEYKPDALLICLFVNDVANTSEKIHSNPFSVDYSRSGVKRVAHILWPRVYTQLKLFKAQLEYNSQTKTTDFIKIVSERAQKQNIPQARINRWKETLPQKLVNAVNQGLFNGTILSKGLFYPEYWRDSIDISSKRAKNKWKSMTNILTELIDRAKKNGVETAVVLIPSPFQYDSKQHNKNNPWIITGTEIRKEWLSDKTKIQTKVKLWAESTRVPFLDLTPVFREAIKSRKNLVWKLDGHWNPRGHQVAANAIASWIEREKIFSFVE